jgi:hypothetical protein
VTCLTADESIAESVRKVIDYLTDEHHA